VSTMRDHGAALGLTAIGTLALAGALAGGKRRAAPGSRNSSLLSRLLAEAQEKAAVKKKQKAKAKKKPKASPASKPAPIEIGPDGRPRRSSGRRSSHPRHPKGLVVNPLWSEPRSPGPWVDSRYCYSCGDSYKDFRGPLDFASAADLIRRTAKAAGDMGGGFRSRRAVLWWMRVGKLDAWYLKHMVCGDYPRDEWMLDPDLVEEMEKEKQVREAVTKAREAARARAMKTNSRGVLIAPDGSELF